MSNTTKFTLADKMAALVALNKKEFSPENYLSSKHIEIKKVIESLAKVGVNEISFHILMTRSHIYTSYKDIRIDIAELLQKDGFKFLDEKTFSEHKELSKANLNRALVSW